MSSIDKNKSPEIFRNPQSSIAVNNRLEALKTLSNSISRQISELQHEERLALQSRIDLAEEVTRYEADLIRCALLRTGGRQRQAARLLNVKISTLNAKIKRFKISIDNDVSP
jgi:DNA-binding NtrC family response regulator